MEHLPKLELPAQGQFPGRFQEYPEPVMIGAGRGEVARGFEIKMRQPAGPGLISGGRLPARFDPAKIGGEIDLRMLSKSARLAAVADRRKRHRKRRRRAL